MSARSIPLVLFFISLLLGAGSPLHAQDVPWVRHTIDRTSEGADGVRLADANGDGLPDVVTGWEEGGLVRIYLHPGPHRVAEPWPSVTVGAAKQVEDAVLVDLDGDGRLDVVSACEGDTRSLYVHWAPGPGQAYERADAWRTDALPAAQGIMQWMFTSPLQVDGEHGLDLFAAGKNDDAQVGWFEAPAEPRKVGGWRWHALSDAGWVMTLQPYDLDGDGDLDLVLSDRRGALRGCRWLEHPGPAGSVHMPWRNHFIGGQEHEVMFMNLADLDGDGLTDALAATAGPELLYFRRLPGEEIAWATYPIVLPPGTGTAKSVAAGDLDGDGRLDLVFSCERAQGKSGVMWLEAIGTPLEGHWRAHEISGPEGTKFDLVQLVDLDGDGDLDVLTCEEAEGLGVVWYENPS